MNDAFTIKQENFEDDNISQIVKKEEETGIKVEENRSYSALFTQPEPDLGDMTIPWKNVPFGSFPSPPNKTDTELHLTKRLENKPFIIIKTTSTHKSYQNSSGSIPDESGKTNSVEKKRQYRKRLKKKAVRVSACKNYIGLICAGFARTILSAKKDSEVLTQLETVLNQKKSKFDSLEKKSLDELIESLKTYIYKHMCGKRIKKKNTERDFKIRNTEELDKLLTITNGDTEPDCVKKEVLKEMLNYFFDSECYNQWLSNGMMNESNRQFFLKNKGEIRQKFSNPAFYKPQFNHHLS